MAAGRRGAGEPVAVAAAGAHLPGLSPHVASVAGMASAAAVAALAVFTMQPQALAPGPIAATNQPPRDAFVAQSSTMPRELRRADYEHFHSAFIPATRLTNYVVAHSEYSSPLGRRSVLTGVLADDDSDPDVETDDAGQPQLPPAQSQPRPSRNKASLIASLDGPLKYSVAFAAVALTAMSSADAADRDAREWLERMSEALATRNYDGRFLHLRDSRTETMRIIHRVEKGKVTERLVSLDGSGREIIRNQNEVICYLPDRRTVLVEKRTDDSTLLATVPLLQRGARSSLQHRARRCSTRRWAAHAGDPGAAARPVPLRLSPVDGRRDVDAAEVAAVRSLRQRHRADRVRELTFRSAFRDAVQAAVDGQDFRWVRPIAQVPPCNVPRGWNVIRLPPGFRMATWRLQAIPGSSVPVRHLVFSDGLASVSVFIEPRKPQTSRAGLARSAPRWRSPRPGRSPGHGRR